MCKIKSENYFRNYTSYVEFNAMFCSFSNEFFFYKKCIYILSNFIDMYKDLKDILVSIDSYCIILLIRLEHVYSTRKKRKEI